MTREERGHRAAAFTALAELARRLVSDAVMEAPVRVELLKHAEHLEAAAKAMTESTT